ncbi:MAG: hypothetical protein KC503_02315, partial [Myxococcales bacterium]|nr:hypothetical protein [Myxococcales bacterium]
PALDGGRIDVPVRGATDSTLDLQIPAGIDVAQPQKLVIEVLGQSFEQTLAAGRSVVVSGDSRVVMTNVHRGDISAAPLVQKTTCVPDTKANCAQDTLDKCGALLHSISPDGRLVVGQCATPAHDELFVIEIPLGKRWTVASSLSPASSTAFVLGGRFLAQIDVQSGELALRAVDSEARTLGAPAGNATIAKGRALRASLDGKHVYVFSGAERGGNDRITRIELLEDAQGVASFDMANETHIDLGDGCPPLPSKCEDDYAKSMRELSAGVLLFARPGLSRVERIDFNSATPSIAISSATIIAAHGLALSASGDRVFTHGRQTSGDNAANGICTIEVAKFGDPPTCNYFTPVGGTEVGFGLAAPPEGGWLAVAFVLPPISLLQTGYRVLQGASYKQVDVGQRRPFHILIQP